MDDRLALGYYLEALATQSTLDPSTTLEQLNILLEATIPNWYEIAKELDWKYRYGI